MVAVTAGIAVVALERAIPGGAARSDLAATATGALADDVVDAAFVGFVRRGRFGGFAVLFGAVAGGGLDFAGGDGGGVEGPDEALFGFVGRVGVGELVKGLGRGVVSWGFLWWSWGSFLVSFTCNSEVRDREERVV